MIDKKIKLSVIKQCKLLSVPRRTYYYRSKEQGDLNKKLQKLIKEQYQKDPTYGSRRMTAYLRRKGYLVNRKRIQRLMNRMGIKAIYPGPKTSIQPKKRIITENLVTTLYINKPNQLWYTDITYIKLSKGYCYAVAIMDAYSKKLLSIRHSNTLDRAFCIEAAKEAIRRYGYPEIIHSDKGGQFLSRDFVKLFTPFSRFSYSDNGYKGNIYIERFFRTYKYECLNLYEIRTIREVKELSQS